MNDTRAPNSRSSFQTQVLIVGGGPVGLAMAIELGWRGIDCILVEKGDGNCETSRIQQLSVRTMEFARRWGIADRLRACGFPEDYPLDVVFCTDLSGEVIGRASYPSMRNEPLGAASPERKQRCPQMWFQPILLQAAREMRSVDVRLRCRLESFVETTGGVTALVMDEERGGSFHIDARYVVACDGAGSQVRRQAGLMLEGDEALSHSVGIYLQIPGLLKAHALGPAERYMFLSPEGLWGNLTVVDGDRHWRLTVLGSRDKLEAADFDAHTWIRRAFGSMEIPYSIDAVLPWRRGRMVANRYAQGRVFLVGDSAHIMSPTGGYGMNTGIQDAVDLAWKLEAALSGWGGSGLLDSYDAERRPVGWRNVEAAAANFRNLGAAFDFSCVSDAGPGASTRRARLGSSLVEGTRAEWEIFGIVLGHRYEDSPIIVPDASPAVPDDSVVYVPTARPGHRAPHAWIDHGRSVLDLFGRGFTLLSFGGREADVAALVAAFRERRVPLAPVAIAQPDVARLYETRLVLVRPDGHVAWRGDGLPPDPLQLVDRIRGGT